MAPPKSFVNSYEESPEALQALLKSSNAVPGSKPKTKPSRTLLIQQHEQHLQELAKSNVPVRSMILPKPYPPSKVNVGSEMCRVIHLQDLMVNERDPSSAIYLRTITSPYIHSSCTTIVEDPSGNVSRLTVGNLEDTMVDPILLESTILAVKQPCWTELVEGGYQIRVDHPNDLVIFEQGSKDIPAEWRRADSVTENDEEKDAEYWKKEGDGMFLAKRFRRALECYNLGLAHLTSHPDPKSSIALHRKICNVQIVLLRLDAAASSLSHAISLHAQSTPSLSSRPMIDFAVVEAWLHNHTLTDPSSIASSIPKPLADLAARIKFDLGVYTNFPEYDLSHISTSITPFTLHVDAASYISDTEIKTTATHGRGLFAKKAFKTGDLICAEKAFVLPGYFIQDPSSDCLLYSLGDGAAAPRPGALLFKELVQKLRWNPSLRKQFFDLDDGGYSSTSTSANSPGEEEEPIDVFRTELIRRLNCFSVPTTTTSLVLNPPPPGTNPELRNGFWLHASYVNHSCLPNAVRTFIGDMHFLRATRSISAGEEISHQYLSPEYDIGERQDRYRGTWGFECDCGLCGADAGVGEGVRKRRTELFEDLKGRVSRLGANGQTITAVKRIARGVRELEALYDEEEYRELPRLALVHPTLFLTEAWRSHKNMDKTIEYARGLLREFGIFTKVDSGRFEVSSCSGLINVEGVRALKYLGEAYEAKGEMGLAESVLETTRIWWLVITGAEVGWEEFLGKE